jgi:hypothetical protein
VQETFGIVLFVVVAVAVVAAVFTFAGTGKLYRQIGRGGFSMDGDEAAAARARAPATGAVANAERDEEVRQMLVARNARRAARGQAPVDVEDELARLVAPSVHVDPALEAEIRSLVVAKNERRGRQGKPPLDVEDEVRRQIAELGGET